jgi:hypothetical protein
MIATGRFSLLAHKQFRERLYASQSRETIKNMLMKPVVLGTKNECAGEGQQEFTRSDFVVL